VVSDTVDIASKLAGGAATGVKRGSVGPDGPGTVDFSDLVIQYYLRFTVRDQPGVLAQISRIFADKNISIASVIQIDTSSDNYVPLVIMTHEAREGDMQEAMDEFGRLDVVRGRIQLIRVEDI